MPALRKQYTAAADAVQAKQGTMWAHQSKVPKLPVPTLEQTMKKYLRTLEPHLSAEELQTTRRLAEDFTKPGGIGAILQHRLLARAQSEPLSWLHNWWYHWAYVDYRDSVVVNVSFFYQFETPSEKVTQLGRATDLTLLFLEVKHAIDTDSFPADVIRGVPQCMLSYKNIFNTCRVPFPNSDYSVRFAPEKSQHILVSRKGQFFTIPVIDAHGNRIAREALESHFKGIIEAVDAGKVPKQPLVGLLTTDHRDKWAVARQDLFADKTIQVIVWANGHAGMLGEHSTIDGYPATMVSDAVLEKERHLWKDAHHNAAHRQLTQVQGSLTSAKHLPFNVSQTTSAAMTEASAAVDKSVANLELHELIFKNFGADFPKTFGVSPDAFVQMAMQLAYYKLHGHFAPCYESCSTRKYVVGRTETGRVMSTDSCNWVKAMVNPQVSDQEKVNLFKQACEAHVNYMKDAADGYGVDRHILGLRLTAKDAGISHPFLTDGAFAKSTHWKLSTSQLPSKYSMTGYGPVVADGYGLYYNIREKQLGFCLSSFRSNGQTSATKMAASLNNTLLEMQRVLAPFVKPAAPKAKL
jgi:carnitine O-acetyltransferase